MAKYFKNVKSFEDLKLQYKDLLKINHPDNGGDVGKMQEINIQYDVLFPIWKDRHNAAKPENQTTETAESTRREFYTQWGWEGSRYDGSLTTKDIAARVRAYVKEKYPFCKFSVRASGVNKLTVSLKEFPGKMYKTGKDLAEEGLTEHIKTIAYDGEELEFNRYKKEIEEMWRTLRHHNMFNLDEWRDEELIAAYDAAIEKNKSYAIRTEYLQNVIDDVEAFVKSYNYDDSDGMIDYFDTNFYFFGVRVEDCKQIEKPARYRKKEASVSKKTETEPQETTLQAETPKENIQETEKEKTNTVKAEVKEEKVQAEERTYYPVNEDTARLAKEMNSFTAYKAGAATEEYHSYCNKAYDILDKIREEKPELAEKAGKKIDYYCRKLAEYYNDYYHNEASCPSVLISGSGNFPIKKKERQNSRRETLRKTWEYLENYVYKIEGILTNEQPVKSGDSDAVEKLKAKIEKLEKEHKMHMDANRYYKKNGTLKGFDGLQEKEAAEIEDFIQRNPVFPPFITCNETANIRRYKKRLEKLVKEKEAGVTEQTETDAENKKLFTMVENKEIMRLQILFDGIPPASVRDILKSSGFKWSRKNKAWQRQLTDNARYAYKNIKDKLKSAMAA